MIIKIMGYKLGQKGEITVGVLLTLTGLFMASVGANYAYTDARVSKIENKVDRKIENDQKIYERIASVETKLDLLLKANGVE